LSLRARSHEPIEANAPDMERFVRLLPADARLLHERAEARILP